MHLKVPSVKWQPFCSGRDELTHGARVTHICVSKLTIIGSDNGLSHGRRQAIIWTKAGILLIGPLGTNFIEILIGIQTFSRKCTWRCHLQNGVHFVSASMCQQPHGGYLRLHDSLLNCFLCMALCAHWPQRMAVIVHWRVSVWSGLQTYVAVDCHGSHSSTPAAPHALCREEEPELWRTISWLSAVPPQIRWDWHFTQLIPVMFVPETFISGNHHENDPFNKWAKTLLKWLVRIHQ